MTRTEHGDGWELRCCDCLDAERGLPSLADKSVDHVMTDPPYESAPYSRSAPGRKHNGRELASLIKMAEGAIGEVSDAGAVCEQIARIVVRWSVVFYDAESIAAWSSALVGFGMDHVRLGAWVKTNPMPQFTGDRPAVGYEACSICHPPGKKRWNGGGRPATWMAATCSGPDRPNHPCPKPVELMEALVRDFTDTGELICDPFAGSGTTGVAAIRLGRRFIGWERDPAYFEIALKRLRAAREQRQLFPDETTR